MQEPKTNVVVKLTEEDGNAFYILGKTAKALKQAGHKELAEQYLRRVPAEDRTERVSGLDILARAHIAEGRVDQAQAPLEELRVIAEAVGTERATQTRIRLSTPGTTTRFPECRPR